MDFVVRPARPEDDPAISAIDRATWSPDNTPTSAPTSDAGFTSQLAPWHRVLAAEDAASGELVGWIIYGQETPIDSGAHTYSLRGLAVAPGAQRRGIARALVAAAIDASRAAGATRLRSRVLATNGPSLRLHEQFGFVVEGTLRGEFVIGGRPVDDVLLALQLDDG
jgi:RimJ/RimL family protein N-acetyltransferase